MFLDLFPGRTLTIRWLAYCEPGGRCRVHEFLKALPEVRRGALEGRMTAWGEHGRWNSKVKYVKRMTTNSSHAIYEIKGFQERVLFVRNNDDAITIDAFIKKDDWSKKDQTVLDAAMRLVDDAVMALKQGKGR